MKLKDRQKLSKRLAVRELDRSTWRVQCEGGCAEVEMHSITVIEGIAYHTVRLDRVHNVFVCDCPGGQYVCKHILAVVGVELRSVTHKIASFWLKEKDAKRQKRPYFHLVAPKGELYTTMRRVS